MNTKKILGYGGIFTVVLTLVFFLAGCGDAEDDDTGGLLTLSGTITISPTSAAVNTKLSATYTGAENVDYLWNKDGQPIPSATNATYTPTQVGGYTVTVSALGYNSKTSAVAAVTTDGTGLPDLPGIAFITPTAANIGTKLTAAFNNANVAIDAYQWNKDGQPIPSATNATYTPTEAGSYTVTLTATGYNPGTSAAVIVRGSNVGDMTWTVVSDNPFGTSEYGYIGAIVYGNDRFVALGGYWEDDDSSLVECIMYSPDGISWTVVSDSTFGSEYGHFDTIAYGNGRFVVAGREGKMAYSSDGISWADTTFEFHIQTIAYGNGRFVAVGWGEIAYSSDGISWTVVSDTTLDEFFFEAIAYGNGRFVAVGFLYEDNVTFIAYSSDGISWAAVSDSPFGTSEYGYIGAIAYGNGRFVAVTGCYDGNAERKYSKMAYSSDGISWTVVSDTTLDEFFFEAIAYGNGRFVAVNWNGEMAYSSDGISWAAVSDSPFGTSEYGYIGAIAYGNGRFVVAGGDRKMAYADW